MFRGVSVQHPRMEAGCGQDASQTRGRRRYSSVLQTAGLRGVLLHVQVSGSFGNCQFVQIRGFMGTV